MRVLPSIEDLQALIRNDPNATVTVPAMNLLAYIQNFQAVASSAQQQIKQLLAACQKDLT